MKRALAILVTITTLVILGVMLSGSSTRSAAAIVETRSLVFTVEVEGTLEAVSTTTLGPPPVQGMWDFKISFLAPEGKVVEAGEPVVRFETRELERRRADAVTERDRARAELEKKNTDLEINQRRIELRLAEAEAKLRRGDLALAVPVELIGRRELDTARVDRDLAAREIAAITEELASQRRASAAERGNLEAQQRNAEALITRLDAEIASLTVRSPNAGTVVYTSDGRREKPKIGDSTWRGGKVVEIPDLSVMRVAAEVDESNLGRVEEGQVANLRLDAHRDLELTGTVAQIRRSVQSRSAREPRRIARLRIDLATTDHERMRPGMRVRGHLEVGRTEPVATLPLHAIVPTASGPIVRVAGLFGREREQQIELGRRDGERVEVVAGLAVGDRVILGEVTR